MVFVGVLFANTINVLSLNHLVVFICRPARKFDRIIVVDLSPLHLLANKIMRGKSPKNRSSPSRIFRWGSQLTHELSGDRPDSTSILEGDDEASRIVVSESGSEAKGHPVPRISTAVVINDVEQGDPPTDEDNHRPSRIVPCEREGDVQEVHVTVTSTTAAVHHIERVDHPTGKCHYSSPF